MSQADTIIALLREGPKTLRMIAAHPSGVFYEFRSRVSELRDDGFDIRCHRLTAAGLCRGCAGSARLTEAQPVAPSPWCPAVALGEPAYQWHNHTRIESGGQLVLHGMGA